MRATCCIGPMFSWGEVYGAAVGESREQKGSRGTGRGKKSEKPELTV